MPISETPHAINVAAREGHDRKNVLLIAHDPAFRSHLREALQEATSSVVIHEAFSAEEAEKFVFGTNEAAGKVLACDWLDLVVISSDLPYPGLGPIVRRLKSDATCAVVPLVVVSREEVIGMKALYSVGCNSFIKLPEELENPFEDLRIVAKYWLCANVSPGDRRLSN
jgi:hypothetical protein